MQNTSQELSSANEEEIQKNLNNELKEIMINNPEAIEIQSSTIMEALKNGYRPLVVDGINKVIQGYTSLTELNNKLLFF